MMKLLPIFLILFLYAFTSQAQYSFETAYNNYPNLPSGILEAVAWTNTHMVHLNNPPESCSGMPKAYGIMGLFEDGKNYFNENGKFVENLSGISIAQQKNSPQAQIDAYASAFSVLLEIEGNSEGQSIRNVLHHLSEIPDSGIVNILARDMQVYSILTFMNSPVKANDFNFNVHSFDLITLFGADNYAVLSSKKIRLTSTTILSDNNITYKLPQNKSVEYGPAIWNPAPSCNFSSRNGTAISHITIHTIQGSYAGAISWSQNCSSNVSFHYVLRSSDGQVTQMVLEADKAWHVGSENPYTVGYEHEGYVDDPSWYTEAMYQSSADLSRDICNSGYGILPYRTFFGDATVGLNTLGACTHIKGHQHYPNQSHTDPGVNWNWEHYYRLINENYTVTNITSANGVFTDTGGPLGNYSDDERNFWLFGSSNSTSVSVNFNTFDLEQDYDFLFIYDGDTISAPLIGKYTGTNSPGNITSTSGSLLIEFRSDCGVTSPGWNADYTITSASNDTILPTTTFSSPNTWKTGDFSVNFSDNDNLNLAEQFYLTSEKNPTENSWHSNSKFVYETFEDNDNQWFPVTGTYSILNGAYQFSDSTEQNSNAYTSFSQNSSEIYVYEWDLTFLSQESNQRAGIHFFCDDPNLSNRGNSYFVYLRESDNAIQILSVDNNIFNEEVNVPFNIDVNQTYNCKVLYNPSTGRIEVYIDNTFVTYWVDSTPHTQGQFISLRTGGCSASFDNIHTYRSRGNIVNISILDEMNFESENALATGLISSLVIDSANNWSNISNDTILLDFSSPELVYLNDGNSTDIDTFSINIIEGNWKMQDIHSGVQNYEIAIGTLPVMDDVYPWTNANLDTMFSSGIMNTLTVNEVYYLSVRSFNNAGLQSQFTSNGQRYVQNVGITQQELEQIQVYPNPATSILNFTSLNDGTRILIYDNTGRLCVKTEIKNSSIDISKLNKGTYTILIEIEQTFVVKKIIKS